MKKYKPSKKDLLVMTIKKLLENLPSRDVNSPEEFTAYLEELANRPKSVIKAEVDKAKKEAQQELSNCTYLY